MNFKKILLVSIFMLFLPFCFLNAFELGAIFRLENLAFTDDRVATDNTFSGTKYLWGGSLSFNHNLTDNISLDAGFYRDTILRNISYTLFNYNIQILNLGVGPFFGLFNSTSTILKSGISTSVRLEFPGLAYLMFRADNSIGGRLIEIGDYIQERNNISFGYYVYNAICSLNINTRKFTQKQSLFEVVDGLVEYSFAIDIFQKNLPYGMLFSFSYQTLSKKFYDPSDLTADPVEHTLNSIILGTEADIHITDYLRLILNLESSIYTFGQNELLGISNPGPAGYLFRASTGVKINFDRLLERRKQSASF